MESFRRRDGSDQDGGLGRNGEWHFHGDRRSSKIYTSTTDPDPCLARKAAGREAKFACTGYLLMENRLGLVVDVRLTQATGIAEPDVAEAMLGDLPAGGPTTVAAHPDNCSR